MVRNQNKVFILRERIKLKPEGVPQEEIDSVLPSPKQIDAVIQRATAKQPLGRFASALELAEAFRTAVSGFDTESAHLTPLPGIEVYNPYKGLRSFQEADAGNKT